MTKEEIRNKIADMARDQNITQYEAAMILYTKRSSAETEAKKDKEKLKDIIQTALKQRGVRAHLVQMGNTDEYATAYEYTQTQPHWNRGLAEKLVPQSILEQILSDVPAQCFTVKVMAEDAAKNRVEESNSQKLKDTDGSLGSKGD